jgi:hypothetical protein
MKTPFENRGAEATEGRTVSTVTPAAAQAGATPAPGVSLSLIENLIKELKGTNEALDYALYLARQTILAARAGDYETALRAADLVTQWISHARVHLDNIYRGESA